MIRLAFDQARSLLENHQILRQIANQFEIVLDLLEELPGLVALETRADLLHGGGGLLHLGPEFLQSLPDGGLPVLDHSPVGLAVAADQVRLLAQRTANSTQEITEMIKKIQLGTRSAVSNMEIGVQQVSSGVEQASQAGDAIVTIRQASASVVGVVDQISLALREQTVASQDVARNVERIAQMSMENSEAVADTSRTAQGLQQLALSLEKQVASFRF